MSGVSKSNESLKRPGGVSPMEEQERIQDFSDAIQHLAEIVDEFNAALDEAEENTT